ncbi:hypothetical protein HPO96_31010 [Kribbella sandramycini]|uniref:Uncharacterized protein n=1 Tax=Kribbella sandramycini TaxID=60450 RepID=A0A7Y4P346_9ACTN|nr:hypothetical protein [Kribbella sandramycini]MBB6566966.1 hypothetical protein [Kribbella sandramycini]NOL44688.1 hypothetical protein [Kribbella sandramycini]
MNKAQLAMAYQACEVADLAQEAVTACPAEALERAHRVLAAAQLLVAAAARLDNPAAPADPLQLFAYEHPDEAADDVSDWLARHPAAASARDSGTTRQP